MFVRNMIIGEHKRETKVFSKLYIFHKKRKYITKIKHKHTYIIRKSIENTQFC